MVCVKTYLLNDDNFNGSCCLIVVDGFGEFVELTKLTGDGFIALDEIFLMNSMI